MSPQHPRSRYLAAVAVALFSIVTYMIVSNVFFAATSIESVCLRSVCCRVTFTLISFAQHPVTVNKSPRIQSVLHLLNAIFLPLSHQTLNLRLLLLYKVYPSTLSCLLHKYNNPLT
jgi:hypothetical protein